MTFLVSVTARYSNIYHIIFWQENYSEGNGYEELNFCFNTADSQANHDPAATNLRSCWAL